MREISKLMVLLTVASTKASQVFNVQWTASVAPEWLGVSANVEVCSKRCLPIYAILNSFVSD